MCWTAPNSLLYAISRAAPCPYINWLSCGDDVALEIRHRSLRSLYNQTKLGRSESTIGSVGMQGGLSLRVLLRAFKAKPTSSLLHDCPTSDGGKKRPKREDLKAHMSVDVVSDDGIKK